MPRKMRGFFHVWWYAIIIVIGITAFVASLESQPSDSDLSGGAGFYAAIIAMCVAATALTKSFATPKYPQLADFSMAIGVCISAYLWVSAEAKTHPLSPELGRSWAILLIVAGVATLLVPMFALALGLLGRDDDSDTDDRDSVDSIEKS